MGTGARLIRAIVLMALLIPGATAGAAPILTSSVLPMADDGVYEYRYELTNPSGSGENIYDLGLFFEGDVVNVLAPQGWGYFIGLGFIDWYSKTVDTDLVEGATLGGFVFQSMLAPGSIVFETTSADPVTGFPTSLPFRGTTVGPSVAPEPVPEPSTLLLLASGAAAVWRAARKRVRPTDRVV